MSGLLARCGLALLMWSGGAGATAMCPLPHFLPVDDYGEPFGGSRVVTEYPITPSEPFEELVVQYFEYQSFESGYLPVFAVTMLRGKSGSTRAVLVRARKTDADVIPAETSRAVPATWVERASRAQARLLHATRYAAGPCPGLYTDGFVIQARVDAVPGFGTLTGEAFSPDPDSGPGAVVDFGRALRGFVEHHIDARDVESALDRLEAAGKREPSLAIPADFP